MLDCYIRWLGLYWMWSPEGNFIDTGIQGHHPTWPISDPARKIVLLGFIPKINRLTSIQDLKSTLKKLTVNFTKPNFKKNAQPTFLPNTLNRYECSATRVCSQPPRVVKLDFVVQLYMGRQVIRPPGSPAWSAHPQQDRLRTSWNTWTKNRSNSLTVSFVRNILFFSFSFYRLLSDGFILEDEKLQQMLMWLDVLLDISHRWCCCCSDVR